MTRRTRALIPILLAGLLACSPESTAPQYQLVVATIAGHEPDDPQVTVSANAIGIVTMTVVTYGTGCYRQGGEDVDINGLDVVVTPFDFAPIDNLPCPGPVQTFQHAIQFSIGQAGNLLITLYGRDAGTDDIVSFEYRLTIQAP